MVVVFFLHQFHKPVHDFSLLSFLTVRIAGRFAVMIFGFVFVVDGDFSVVEHLENGADVAVVGEVFGGEEDEEF